MNHQPFEEWLLTDEPLEAEDAAALQEHLQGCESCRQISLAWQAVEGELRSASVSGPQPGFTRRFLDRLEADRHKLHRRQSLLILGFATGGAALLFGSLLLLTLPNFQSPTVLGWTLVYRLWGLLIGLEQTGDTAAALLRSLVGGVSPLAWMLLAGALTELGVLWVVSYRLLTQTNRA